MSSTTWTPTEVGSNARRLQCALWRAVEAQHRVSTIALVDTLDASFPPSKSSAGSAKLEEMSLEEVEFFLIKKALARYNGNVSQAAGALGLSRSALYRRLERHGL